MKSFLKHTLGRISIGSVFIAALAVALVTASSGAPLVIKALPVSVTNPAGAGAGALWSNAGNITASDNACAEQAPTVAPPSPPLVATGFNFNVPAGATILGVRTAIKAAQTGVGEWQASLVGVGTSASRSFTPVSGVPLTCSDSTSTSQGGATDTWSAETALTVAAVNSAAFGVSVAPPVPGVKFVDFIQITLFYRSPTPPAPSSVTPASAGSVTSTSPTISGAGAQPNATVTVLVDGASIGTTVADSAGAWSKLVPGTLGQGAHTTAAKQLEPVADEISATSAALNFTVDTISNAPGITSPVEGGTVTPTSAFSGSCDEDGSTIRLFVDGIQQTSTGTCASSVWTITTDVLAIGTHSAAATQTDVPGNVSAASATRAFNVTPTGAGPS